MGYENMYLHTKLKASPLPQILISTLCTEIFCNKNVITFMTSNTFCRRHIDVLTGVTMWVAGLEIKAKKLRSITKQIDLGIRIKKTDNRKK